MAYDMHLRALSEHATLALGAALAKLNARGIIGLAGELGAGKTTLVRAWLRALGWQGQVKSPTFTLIESYALNGLTIHHIDLYRLHDASELECLGFRDLLRGESLCLIEWPQRARDLITEVNIAIDLDYDGEFRQVHLHFTDEQLGKQFANSIRDSDSKA